MLLVFVGLLLQLSLSQKSPLGLEIELLETKVTLLKQKLELLKSTQSDLEDDDDEDDDLDLGFLDPET